MTVLVGAARRRDAEVVDSTPYTMPTEWPFNPPAQYPAITPTADGSGQMIHPGVLDFKQINGWRWRGWRYWMAGTPYPGSDVTTENPHILVSQDGFTWQEPSPGINPVFPLSQSLSWHSDTDLEYDPETDELVMVWRSDPMRQTFSRSADGVAWSPKVECTFNAPGGSEMLSPAAILMPDGQWRIWIVNYDDRTVYRFATSDLAHWGTPTVCTGNIPTSIWHMDITRHPDGRFLMVWHDTNGAYSATSLDGLHWTVPARPPFFQQVLGSFHQPYRPSATVHEDGVNMRVWVSTRTINSTTWATYYTHVPLSWWT